MPGERSDARYDKKPLTATSLFPTPVERSDARPHNEPASDPRTSHAERAKRRSYPTKGPSMPTPFPNQPANAGRPGFP